MGKCDYTVVALRMTLRLHTSFQRQNPDSASTFLECFPRLSAVQEGLLGIDEEESLNDSGTNTQPPTSVEEQDKQSSNDLLPSTSNQDTTPGDGSTAQTQALPEPAELARVARRIVNLLDEEDAVDTPLRRLYSRTTARVFADFCDALSLDRSAINLNSRAAKKALFSLFITEVSITTLSLSYYLKLH